MKRALLERFAVIVLLLFVVTALAVRGETCVESIQLIPKAAAMQQLHGRYTYAVRVRVRQHPEHRRLELTWFEDGLKAGRSVRPLDGDEAPVTFTFAMRDQVAGHYVFTATVFDDRGKAVGQARTETVLVGEEDNNN